MTTNGIKHDAGKPRMELLSTIWLVGVAKVLTLGALKYHDDNWRLGLSQRRVLGAALRHLFSYLDGEDLDPETGLSHLDHASCELMFARELRETRPEMDDRYKSNPATDQKFKVPELKTEIKETVFTSTKGMEKIAGEWVVVSVDGKDKAAFVPSAVKADVLPNELYLPGGAA